MKIIKDFYLSFELDQEIMEEYKINNGIDINKEALVNLKFSSDEMRNRVLFEEMVSTCTRQETKFNTINGTERNIFTGVCTPYITFNKEFNINDHIITLSIVDKNGIRRAIIHSENCDNDLLCKVMKEHNMSFNNILNLNRDSLYNDIENDNVGILDMYYANISNTLSIVTIVIISTPEKHILKDNVIKSTDPGYVFCTYILNLPTIDILDYKYDTGFRLEKYDMSKFEI